MMQIYLLPFYKKGKCLWDMKYLELENHRKECQYMEKSWFKARSSQIKDWALSTGYLWYRLALRLMQWLRLSQYLKRNFRCGNKDQPQEENKGSLVRTCCSKGVNRCHMYFGRDSKTGRGVPRLFRGEKRKTSYTRQLKDVDMREL